MFKKILIGAGIALFILLAVSSWLDRSAAIRAQLVNDELKKKVTELEADKTKTIADSEAFAKAKKEEIAAKDKASNEKLTAANAIITRTAGQVFAIRNEKLTLEDKYDKLEDDALKKGDKIILLEGSNSKMQQEIVGYKELDVSRLKTIADLTFMIDDPVNGYKSLLEKSIKNTESVIKKGWVLKLFDRITVVAGYGVNAKGDFSAQLTAGIAIF